MIDPLVCSQCATEYPRPSSLSTSTFAQCPFVCENCRCKRCSVVLNIECACGIVHGKRSTIDSALCESCEGKIAELIEEEPIYGFQISTITQGVN
jgi:hypothetical protein